MGEGSEVDASRIKIFTSPAAIMAAITGGALAVSAILNPVRVTGLSLCPISHLIGIECPFCGMTRSFVSITHARFSEALDYNLGSPLIYGAFVWMLFASIRDLRLGQYKDIPSTPIWLYKSWLTVTIPVFAWLFWSRWLSNLF
ncbi:MAG: DUF2752 domain-containing protein [Euryarchaeota archaeon]|mgnify:CR=1 FL=1|jgi:hypothetical protein|nr:DUF2752 domain-containing protein [Euryarchaeota archaeon]